RIVPGQWAARLPKRARSSLGTQPALRAWRLGELVDEARLAHPRLAHDCRDLTMTLAGEPLGPAELLQLGIATDETREPASRCRLQTRPYRPLARDLEDLHGLAEPLHIDEAERLDLDEPLSETERVGAHEDRARHGELLHARGEMSRLAHRRVVHVQIVADGPDHDLSRIETDPDVDEGALLASNLVRVPLDGFLHQERGVTRSHCVVLVGDRRSEKRHDSVAHHLVHSAFVPMHGLHHVLQDGVEYLARFLGIAIGEQFHRALEVGEQDADLLALAFEGALGREDLLGQVPRGVGLGRDETRSRGSRRRWARWVRALRTELGSSRQLPAAVTTGAG